MFFSVERRRILLAAALAGAGSTLAGCGGGSSAASPESTPSPPGAPPPDASFSTKDWTLPPLLVVAGTVLVLDLSATLPTGVPRGGSFAVDSSGGPLPAGVTLTSAGMLSAVGGAVLNLAAGVVFSYTEPG